MDGKPHALAHKMARPSGEWFNPLLVNQLHPEAGR